MSRSYDSGQRPLTNVEYQSTNNPYNSGAGFYGESSGFLPPPQSRKRGTSPWIKFGIPVLIIVAAGAIVGGILGSRAHKNSSSTNNTLSNPNDPGAASAAAANKQKIGAFAVSTDSYGLPVYPTGTSDAAAYVAPTFVSGASGAWPTETWTPPSPQPSTPSANSIRPDRPRLIAPKYKWDALASIVPNDPYMKQWNDTIIGNATAYKNAPLIVYNVDGGLTLSGVLDVARQVKERIKAYAYAFRVTGDQQWVSRCWDELQNAAANSSQPFGTAPDNWNSQHFLDLAEFTAAFAIGYDWLYDQWNDQQKTAIMWSIINLGLNYGVQAFKPDSSFGWWSLPENGQGNWNCVCNSGLTMGALAILQDDPTGVAETILGLTIPNALSNCAQAPTSDGSWTETANYWYFGTMAHSEMTASLISATGSDYGMLHTNPHFNGTGLYHMYITGMTSLFNYGDHGPNKYSTNADGMMFYGGQYGVPSYMLFQRDQRDAWSDPWAMFWYDPTVTGAFWENLPLDHFFDDNLDQWGSMRTSWTSNDGMYMAVKAGNNSGHQNHNDLDVGDFVMDAMGQRWAGELGSGDYDAPGYFNGGTQDGDQGQRWLYYRKRTEGQNTIVVGEQNQLITAAPTIKFGSTNEAQDASTTYTVPKGSTAWFTMDSTSAYTNVTSMKRGLRFINDRKQALLQDEVNTSAPVQWRMHTNATVTPNGSSATLALGGKTMKVQILSPSGATFGTANATRYPSDPPPPKADQDNPGVTVLTIDLQAGQNQIQVLFNPQWDGMSDSDFVTPPTVALDSWSTTSHN